MKVRVNFQSDSCKLADVRRQVRDFLEGCGFDECAAEMVVLALDEACTNVIRHAYHLECKPVKLEMEHLKNQVRFTLRDYGESCDPAQIKSRSLEEIRPGGVGVHIIKQVFDEVSYQPCTRGTRLIMTKYLP